MPPIGKNPGTNEPRQPTPAPPAAPRPPAAPVAPAAPKVAAPAALIGANPLVAHDPVSKAVAATHDPKYADKQARRAAVILRRQHILKSTGIYKGQVDGIWGQQSQQAWSVYVDRRRKGRSLTAPYLGPNQILAQERKAARDSHVSQMRQNARQVRQQNAQGVAAIRAQTDPHRTFLSDNLGRDRLQAQRAAADVRAQLARETKVNVDTMRRLRNDPQAVAKVNIHQLTAAVTDKANGWKATNASDVLVVQRWLNSHGQPVGLSGKFDKQTNDALKLAYDHAAASEHDRAVHTVVERFYAGGYHPGDRPSWWTQPGPVPAPGDLLKQLQQGGFYADSLLRQILSNIDFPALDYQGWRRQQLDKMLTTYQGQWDAPNWIAGSGSLGVTAANVLTRANRVLSPQAQSQFKAQLDTLVNARSGDEFSRRIGTAIRMADRTYQVEQAARARRDVPWWGTVIKDAVYPLDQAEKAVHFVKTAAIADFYQGADLLTVGGTDPKTDYWAEALGAQKNAPVGLRLASEWVADPLIFLRPFRIASTGLKYGLRILHIADDAALGGYKLAAAGEKVGLLARRAEYTTATWHLPVKAGAATLLRRVPGVDTALAMKSVVVDKAQGAVVQAARHGFEKPRKLFAQLGEHATFQNALPAETRAMLMDARDGLAKQIESNYPHLFDALRGAGASLYLDAHRRTLSSIGAQLVARHAEEVRVQEVHRLANHYSQDVYERTINGGYTDAQRNALMVKHGVHDNLIPGKDGAPDSTILHPLPGRSDKAVPDFEAALQKLVDVHPEPPLDQDAAVRRAFDEYQRVKAAAGLFIKGSGDPEITAVVDRRVAAQLEQWQEVLVPAIQDTLEAHYAGIGHELWDPASGLWAARDDAATRELTAFARDAFLPENLVQVDNPLYGKEMSFAEALPIIESEVRRRQSRILGWADREAAAGKPVNEDALHGLLAYQRHLVENAFVEGDASYHVVLNRDNIDRLLAEQGVPTTTPIEVVWKKGSKAWGEYHGKQVRIFADPDVLNEIRVGGETAEAHIVSQYHATVAHEIRHAFQDLTWEREKFLDDSLGYWNSPVEVDARTFMDSEYVKTFDQLVSVVKPRAGVFVDGRQHLRVPDLYARDQLGTFTHPQPRWMTPADATTGRLPENEQSVLAASPRDVRNTSIDQEIGRNAWNLGTMHADMTAAFFGGLDPTARRFSAAGMTAEDAQAYMERAGRFREAVQKYHIALGAATDQALPYSLKDNGVLMVALAHAQSLPLRALYKTLDGVMNTWIFATLPLRSGWVVRNVLDNAIKTFIAGVHDPRAYFRPFQGGRASQAVAGGLESVVSIFDAGVGQLLEAVRFLDGLFGTNGADHFETLLNTFWANRVETIQRVFRTQGWDVPDEVLNGARLNPFQRRVGPARLTKTGLFNPDELDQLPTEFQDAYRKHFKDSVYQANKMQRFRDGMWHLMANTPENYYKKVLYNDTIRKLRAEGVPVLDAHDQAWAKVEATLFDYSKISAVEDNLRLFFPFIQFWRKNTGLWARNFATKPWLTVELNNYMRARDEQHADWPDWMKRYVNVQEITDAAATVPGLGWLATAVLPNDGQFDPLSFASFSPYLRAFKSENQSLPADQQGNALFGPMIDALNDWGLGLSPFFRKPLESAHIASTRAWQTVFPETALAAALTRKFFGDTQAGHVMDWERIFTLFQGRTPSDEIAQNFEFYVRRAEENQLARGETVNRAAAEAETRTWFLAQNLWGFFGGVYFRKNSPEDFFTAQLQDQVMKHERDYADLSEKEKLLLQVWKRGGIDKATGRLRMDRQAWDRYVEAIPLIEAFYTKGSYQDGAAFLQEHPEISQYVDPKFTKGRYYGENYAKAAAMYLHGADWFHVDRLLTSLQLPYDMRKAAASVFITDDLQQFWAKNDTPADLRNKMVAAELHGYLNDLNESYWAIPETDAAARRGFLHEHPNLERSWQHNNSASDDYHTVLNGAKGDLRETYFATVREHGFGAAAGFLQQYSFMFEGTKAESHIDEQLGAWIPGGKGSKKGAAYRAAHKGILRFFELMKRDKKAAYAYLNSTDADAQAAQHYFDRYGSKHNTERAVAFRAARPALRYYFNLRDHGDKAAANAWLHSDTPLAKQARDYFRKWAKTGSYHAHDFLRAQKWLTLYWHMAPADRHAWLDGKTTGALIVRRYFAKWGHEKGMSAHALDYTHAQGALAHYFALSKHNKADADKWLHGGSHDAARVLDYFKKYSTTAKLERAFRSAAPDLATTDPELRRRLDFWRSYYVLTPDLRPAFVHDQAEAHGIFIFGALGDGDTHNREQKFVRAAMAATVTVDGKKKHLSERQATYLYVKPLLNQLYTIPKRERGMFIDANPELAAYIAAFSKPTITGDPKLDAKIEYYFSLPQGSKLRADVLKTYPEVQGYFNQHSTPAQRAILSLLDTFFKLPGRERNAFKLDHPEIQAYFDRRRQERAATAAITGAFEQADPRLHDYFTHSTADLGPSAERMRAILREAHLRQFTPDALGNRRERQPQKAPGFVNKPHKPPT